MNGALHDDDIQDLYHNKGFDIATREILTNKEFSKQRIDNFIAFTTIFVADARQSAAELMLLSSATLVKTNLVKLKTFTKQETCMNTRRYIEMVRQYGAEAIGIMECTPFGWHFVTDRMTRRVITNFKMWILASETLPDTTIGFMLLTREVKHELNEVAWILLEAAHRCAIQLKLFMSYYDKLY